MCLLLFNGAEGHITVLLKAGKAHASTACLSRTVVMDNIPVVTPAHKEQYAAAENLGTHGKTAAACTSPTRRVGVPSLSDPELFDQKLVCY